MARYRLMGSASAVTNPGSPVPSGRHQGRHGPEGSLERGDSAASYHPGSVGDPDADDMDMEDFSDDGDDRSEIDRRADRPDVTLDDNGDEEYRGSFRADKDTHPIGLGAHTHGKFGKHVHLNNNSHDDSQMIADEKGSDSRFDAHRFASERANRDAGKQLREKVDRMALKEYGKPLSALPPDQRRAAQQQLLVHAFEHQQNQRNQRDVRPGRLVASADYNEDVERAAARIALSEYGRLELTGPEMLDTYRRSHRLAEHRMAERRNGGRA